MTSYVSVVDAVRGMAEAVTSDAGMTASATILCARARRAVERDVVEDEWNDRVDGRVGGEDARGARWWR